MPSIISKLRRIVCLRSANMLHGTRFFAAKRWLFSMAGIEVGEGSCVVGPIHIGKASLTIGKHTWIGHDLYIEGNGSVLIGDNVDVAPWVVFSTGGHEMCAAQRRAGSGLTFEQRVGDGTWIGIRSLFVNGVTVGDSCVVAGGAVVTSDVAQNTLVGGVPAHVIRRLEQ